MVCVRPQVRKHVPGNPVTLAIGDGANDVDMIKMAEVGRVRGALPARVPASRAPPQYHVSRCHVSRVCRRVCYARGVARVALFLVRAARRRCCVADASARTP